MKLFLLCIVLFPFGVFSQTKTEIVSYDVQVRLNENDNSISGKIIVSLSQIVNSDFNYIFLTPKGWNIHSIEDTEENSFDVELVRTDNTNVGQYQVELPSSFNINDTLRMVIDFTAMLDTVSSKNVFVNKKEFVLSQSDTLSWLPNFGATNVHQYSFEFSTPTTWTIFAEEPMDTIYTEGLRMWKRSNRNIASLSSAFALYGINNASIHTAFGSDSLAAVSFYSQPEKFNQQYAAALVKQLQEAFLFFSSLTQHTAQQMDFTVASIGTEHFDKPFFASKQLLILRNSPAYAVYDSLLLLRSQYNRWLTKLALQFTPQSAGASVLLREGFASYLAMRFLMVSQPEIEKNERLYSLSRALSFFFPWHSWR